MKSVLFVIVQCLVLSIHISLCSDTNCEIESEPCELENGGNSGECKVISQCESELFVQNITHYPEGSNELICCKQHVRQTRGTQWRGRSRTTYVIVQPKRQRYRQVYYIQQQRNHNHQHLNNNYQRSHNTHQQRNHNLQQRNHNPQQHNHNPQQHKYIPQQLIHHHQQLNHNHQQHNHNQQQHNHNHHDHIHNQQNGLDVIVPVVGGRDAEPGEFPFMAALGFPTTSGGYDYRCGGFFVSPNRVVTAAHCSRVRGSPPEVVLPGGANLNSNEQRIPIADIIRHPSYRPRQVYNDIAVVKLSGSSPNPPAQLWRTAINFDSAIAIGYGHTEFGGKISNVLQRVALSLFTNSFCSRFYPAERRIESGLITSQLCAGEIQNPVDTCQGDSGGPLLVNVNSNGARVPYVIGVTSFGTGCAGGVPSIYTRISPYVSWIETI